MTKLSVDSSRESRDTFESLEQLRAVRHELTAHRARGVPFATAWARAMSTRDKEICAVLRATAPSWRAAYNGDPPPTVPRIADLELVGAEDEDRPAHAGV